MSLKKTKKPKHGIFDALVYSGILFFGVMFVLVIIALITRIDLGDITRSLRTLDPETFIPILYTITMAGVMFSTGSYLQEIPEEEVYPKFKNWLIGLFLIMFFAIVALAVYVW